jgi:hypothetical protein
MFSPAGAADTIAVSSAESQAQKNRLGGGLFGQRVGCHAGGGTEVLGVFDYKQCVKPTQYVCPSVHGYSYLNNGRIA